jgi:hypothetical protein
LAAKKSQQQVSEELLEKGFSLIDTYKNALTKVMVKRVECGHEFLERPSSITRGRNILCPMCTKSRRRGYSHIEFTQELKEFFLEPVDTYTGFKNNVRVKSTVCGHEYTINPGHLLYDGIGKECLVCKGIGSIKNRFLAKLSELNLELQSEYATTQTPVLLTNKSCGHTYEVIPNNLVCASSGEICRVCCPTTQVSSYENEIYAYIKSIYSGWIERSDRTILNGKELDIVLPDLGIAIEVNGAKWHSEDTKGTEYHLLKTTNSELEGYRLIHIFDTEWLASSSIVKSRLSNIIGDNRVEVIYARKCIVKEIPFPGQFLVNNHIQGAGSITKYNYGLFYKSNLVAVMTFSAPRFSNATNYELVRYCSAINTRVIGGASKLLAAFRKRYQGSILSYSDKRWSNGTLYKILGFAHSNTSQPNYKYYKYKTILSRYQCQKHLLKTLVPKYYEETLSETEIMKRAGFNKVYDCGNDVWILK